MGAERDDVLTFVRAVLAVDGVYVRPASLADDAVLLGMAFPDVEGYRVAAASTVRALRQLVSGAASGTELCHDLAGWRSFHYQSSRSNGSRADMRIVYRDRPDGGIDVWSFGHRHVPSSFYWRLRGKERP